MYQTTIAFLCCKLETCYFDEHYYGYFVSLTSEPLVFVKRTNLPHLFPTVINTVSTGEQFVTYKYGL